MRTFLCLSLSLMSLALVFSGCTSTTKKNEVRSQIAAEPAVSGQDQLVKKSHMIILDHPNLSAAQKQQMNDLYVETYRKTIQVRRQLSQAKGVFFKELLSEKSDAEKVDILKTELVKLNDQKIQIMLDALAKTRKILGRTISPEQIQEHFNMFDRL